MSVFRFKHFEVKQNDFLHKVGTDAMVLGAMVQSENPDRILDVGTGIGIIALMLAQKFPKASITALDIELKAFVLAKSNFKHSPFSDRIEAIMQNFMDYRPDRRYDLIVSNPPYFDSSMPSIDPNRALARTEGTMTLDGLIFHSNELLTPRGCLWMIVPVRRAEELIKIKERLEMILIQRIRIYGKPEKQARDILVFQKEKKQIDYPIIDFYVRDKDGKYSLDYIELTKEFHGKNIR